MANNSVMAQKPVKKKKIALALQGGAAYGAFTWGVLDRLLEDERIEITAVSGTSAGAMNAAALASGLDENGAEGAKNKLKELWNTLAYDEVVKNVPYLGGAGSKSNRMLSRMLKQVMPETAAGDLVKTFKAFTQGTTMSLINGKDGLFEEQLEKIIDFDTLRSKKDGIPLFVAATDINAHKERIFDRSDVTAKAVKASCALPLIVGAVEIDGRLYWDGGYLANPAIAPLKDGDAADILVIQTIHMQERDGMAPIKSGIDRLMEFTNNASLRRDLEEIGRDNARIAQNPKAAKALGLREIRTHGIQIGKELKAEHMMCFDRDHIDELYAAGRKAADDWIRQNFRHIGRKSTFTRDAVQPPAQQTARGRKTLKTRAPKSPK